LQLTTKQPPTNLSIYTQHYKPKLDVSVHGTD